MGVSALGPGSFGVLVLVERWFGSSWTLIYGIIFMLIVIFLPYGIVGTVRARSLQLREGWQRWRQQLRG